MGCKKGGKKSGQIEPNEQILAEQLRCIVDA
jgi:hypothetical protein